jgi:D-alanyl-lipoteichoic acid acyltransferase DltB (MBOAT superfamily)
MLFSSFDFIVLFLPLVAIGYFLIGRYSHRLAMLWLTAASLFFYAWWNAIYVGLIVASTVFNYGIGVVIRRKIDTQPHLAKMVMVSGIVVDLAVLGFFKYADFLIGNINAATGATTPLLHIILPLGLSFFTFQKIAYLVDCYKRQTVSGSFLDFSLFVTFFPQLIAGPIVHHKEMMPQFADASRARVNWDNIACGLFVFAIGLFKKVVIADSLAKYATWGFDEAPLGMSLPEAWLTMFSYTFQIYFDFSGYTDMAIGAALLFNIKIPANFNSPYKARNIRDFWQRWHMTLSRFLRDYLYIPLGGNRHGIPRQIMARLVTFLRGGLWHGANWTFVAWGAMHGVALMIFVLWEKTKIKFPLALSWFLTFLFVNLTWVVFRATDWDAALKIYTGLVDVGNLELYDDTPIFSVAVWLSMALTGLLALCVGTPNSNTLSERFKPEFGWFLFTFGLAAVAFFRIGNYSEFLYFQF